MQRALSQNTNTMAPSLVLNRETRCMAGFLVRIHCYLVEFTPVIQHGDSRRTALEEWITSSRAKPHEQDVNE